MSRASSVQLISGVKVPQFIASNAVQSRTGRGGEQEVNACTVGAIAPPEILRARPLVE